MCKWGKFDILAHLTYPLRYINGIAKLNVDISQYNEIISESFRLLIQNGKGIEINKTDILWIQNSVYTIRSHAAKRCLSH